MSFEQFKIGGNNLEKQSQEWSERIKHSFGHCFEVFKFENGDAIPAGGGSIFSNETDIKIAGDFESLKMFIDETHELAERYDLSKLRGWLDLVGTEIDEKLFARLLAFTEKLEVLCPENSKRLEMREELYKEKGEGIKLSDVFDKNVAACVEIATLAQVYLQEEGVCSSFFSGDVLWNEAGGEDLEFSDAHSFIVIRDSGRQYIYDPSNPTNTTAGKFPSIYTMGADFDKEMARGEKKFVTAQNILSKKEVFYGVNDFTNIIPERDIV